MPVTRTFSYQAFTADGRRVSRRERARSLDALRDQVRQAGLFLCAGSIRERGAGTRHRPVRLSMREQAEIFQHLELQLGAGVLSDEAIQALAECGSTARLRRTLQEIHAAITTGRMSITEAFEHSTRVSPGILAVIRAGERAGAAELGRRFADLRDRLEFSRMVRGVALRAFQYPAVVGLLGCGFVVFVFSVLVPVLARVLETVNVPLPPVTAAVIGCSHFLVRNLGAIGATVAALPVAWATSRRLPRVSAWLDAMALKLPGVGRVYRSLATSVVFRTYASLYEAGEPAPEILELCEQLVRNRAMRRAIVQVRARVLAGDPLHVAFQRARLFPADACAMVRTGESAGLGESMRRSAQHHATYARDRITFLLSWLEPATIIGLGAFVGLVAYAFFTPILSIYGGIR